MLWLLEHVHLRVDPLKDAAGSPFGKADRLYLYLHDQKLYVEWGSTNTTDTLVFMMKISHILKCEGEKRMEYGDGAFMT